MSDGRSRAATVPLIAGVAVLDLVNTVSWRGAPRRAEDHLREPDDCLDWAGRTGVLSDGERETLHRSLPQRTPHAWSELAQRLQVLRETVADSVLTATPESLDGAAAVIVDAFAHSRLELVDGGYRWVVNGLDEHTIARRLALQLHTLLTTNPGRVGVCDDPNCRWVFLDTSRGHRRRWCDSRDCGNRFRARKHQERVAPTAAHRPTN